MFIDPVSEADWIKTLPLFGNSLANHSMISFWGVMG
jgi:hypothetical protein